MSLTTPTNPWSQRQWNGGKEEIIVTWWEATQWRWDKIVHHKLLLQGMSWLGTSSDIYSFSCFSLTQFCLIARVNPNSLSFHSKRHQKKVTKWANELLNIAVEGMQIYPSQAPLHQQMLPGTSLCLNGGACQEICNTHRVRFSCVCPSKYTGQRCEKATPKSCEDIPKYGASTSGKYGIFDSNNEPWLAVWTRLYMDIDTIVFLG